MTIAGTDNNNSYIGALFFLKYEDIHSFYKTFKNINQMFQFNPKVIHIDYSNSLWKALLTKNLFKTKPTIIHFFFHFVQSIVKHMKKYGLIKK